MRTPTSITEVAERQLCTGCGACAFAQPDVIRMVDDPDTGLRPLVQVSPDGSSPDTARALSVCPGVALAHDPADRTGSEIEQLSSGWGPVLEVWEGWAADPEVRWAGSSGGAATALATHCLESQSMHGVLHIRAREDAPHLNRTVLSRSRDELLRATGSRYAPASPCDGLHLVETAPDPCVFIGKPCDVAATFRARRDNEALDRNLGLTIAIFCAGTPSTRGTVEMLREMGFEDPGDVSEVRYRGQGWPGRARAVGGSAGQLRSAELSYERSWGEILQKHRQWRCHICPDHSGEFADISVGDPWYEGVPDDAPGRSLIVARTERGRRILHDAVTAGVLVAHPVKPELLPASQPNLLRARGALWGRLMTLRLMGVPTPRFDGLPTFRFWWSVLTFREKLQSMYGTLKRVFRRGLLRRQAVTPTLEQPDTDESREPILPLSRVGPHT